MAFNDVARECVVHDLLLCARLLQATGRIMYLSVRFWVSTKAHSPTLLAEGASSLAVWTTLPV